MSDNYCLSNETFFIFPRLLLKLYDIYCLSKETSDFFNARIRTPYLFGGPALSLIRTEVLYLSLTVVLLKFCM